MNEKPRHKYHVVILAALIIVALTIFALCTEKKSTPNYDPASLSARLLEVQKNLSEVQKELQSIQNELAKAQKTPVNEEGDGTSQPEVQQPASSTAPAE